MESASCRHSIRCVCLSVRTSLGCFTDTHCKLRSHSVAQKMSLAVQRVGAKIVEQAANPVMKWQFHVIDSPEPNAFCLPGEGEEKERLHACEQVSSSNAAAAGRLGGKVFVNSGLFKVLRNEDSLAAVLFHEAAHGIARMSLERAGFIVPCVAVVREL